MYANVYHYIWQFIIQNKSTHIMYLRTQTHSKYKNYTLLYSNNFMQIPPKQTCGMLGTRSFFSTKGVMSWPCVLDELSILSTSVSRDEGNKLTPISWYMMLVLLRSIPQVILVKLDEPCTPMPSDILFLCKSTFTELDIKIHELKVIWFIVSTNLFSISFFHQLIDIANTHT